MSNEELIKTLKEFEEERVEQLPERLRNLFYKTTKALHMATNNRKKKGKEKWIVW